MNKNELAAALSARTSLSTAECTKAVDALSDVLRACAADGTRLHLPGIMTLERVERPARTGRNPRTGEPLEIAASHGVKITPGATLKAAARGER